MDPRVGKRAMGRRGVEGVVATEVEPLYLSYQITGLERTFDPWLSAWTEAVQGPSKKKDHVLST